MIEEEEWMKGGEWNAKILFAPPFVFLRGFFISVQVSKRQSEIGAGDQVAHRPLRRCRRGRRATRAVIEIATFVAVGAMCIVTRLIRRSGTGIHVVVVLIVVLIATAWLH